MTNFKIWLEAARPKTLWAGAAPVIIGMAMAKADGVFYFPAAFAALIGALLIQIGTNYANDYFDYVKGTDTEDRVGPTRATQAGLVTPRAMLLATALVFWLAVLIGFYLAWRGGWPIVAIGVISIACGVLYTGGPYPLGYLGLGDVFVLIFFGPVAVGGTYYVQAQSWDLASLIAGLAPGLFSVAILTVNNLRDIDTDAKTGKKTLAVRFGRSFARLEYVIALFLGAVAVPAYLCWAHDDHWNAMIAALIFPFAVPAMVTVFTKTDGPSLNTILATTGKLLLIFSLLFSVGWIL